MVVVCSSKAHGVLLPLPKVPERIRHHNRALSVRHTVRRWGLIRIAGSLPVG